MRFIVLAALACTGALIYVQAQESPPAASAPSSAAKSARITKFDPRLAPQYVELLKLQAQTRKDFYAGRAKASEELKTAHVKQREELILNHRAARKIFEDQKPPRSERSMFFKNQRAEMTALQARQKADLLALDVDLDMKLAEFHTQQRKAREELAARLLKEHR